jgi:hypothetical protein
VAKSILEQEIKNIFLIENRAEKPKAVLAEVSLKQKELSLSIVRGRARASVWIIYGGGEFRGGKKKPSIPVDR